MVRDGGGWEELNNCIDFDLASMKMKIKALKKIDPSNELFPCKMTMKK